MRIVGGALSGRRFRGPPGGKTRPTTERAREAIASALESRGWIDDRVVLDLFAGTGALAFEALSRGARRGFLVERDRRVARSIVRSADELGLSADVRVIHADVHKPSKWHAQIDEPVGLLFADPPYAEAERVGSVLQELSRATMLAPLTVVVLEHDPKHEPSLPDSFSVVARYKYGDSALLLIEGPP